MPTQIIPKKSTVANKFPATTDLAHGEIAINYADAKLYGRHPATGDIIHIASANTTTHETGWHINERGFNPDTLPVLSATNGASDLTIALTGTFDVQLNGMRFSKSSDSLVIPHANLIEGVHYVYYTRTNQTLNLNVGITLWEIDDNAAPVCIFYWDNTNKTLVGNLFYELHQWTMDWRTHAYLHRTRGTAYIEGLGISGYTLATDTNDAVTVGVADGKIADEDITISIKHAASPTNAFEQILSEPAQIPVWYREGTSNWRKTTANNYAVRLGANSRAAFNSLAAGTWGQTEATSGNFVAMFVFAGNDIREPVFAIQGQRQDTSLANAQANNAFNTLNLGNLPAAEFKLLYRIIYRTRSTNTNAIKSTIEDVQDYRASISAGSTAIKIDDHGNLTGLADDDHSQYALTAANSTRMTTSISNPANGNVLTYNSTSGYWEAGTSSGGVSVDECIAYALILGA